MGTALAKFNRLVLENAVLFAVYFFVLLFIAGQKSFYLDIFQGLTGATAIKEKELASTL